MGKISPNPRLLPLLPPLPLLIRGGAGGGSTRIRPIHLIFRVAAGTRRALVRWSQQNSLATAGTHSIAGAHSLVAGTLRSPLIGTALHNAPLVGLLLAKLEVATVNRPVGFVHIQ